MKFVFSLILILAAAIFFSALIAGRKATTSTLKVEPHQALKEATDKTPVIVELFTSEGCSSCPPADEVLTRLASTQPVAGALIIPLGQHVDYWNQLGWKDPFSSPALSARQGDYAQVFGRSEVYTPQMIVNGLAEFSGGNYPRAVQEIERAAHDLKGKVEINPTAEKNGAALKTLSLNILVSDLPKITAHDSASVVLAITEDNLQSSVARGENEGRLLRHAAVVRRLTQIGEVNAGQDGFKTSAGVEIEPSWKRENLHAVVFVQEQKSRRVLGAATLSLVANQQSSGK